MQDKPLAYLSPAVASSGRPKRLAILGATGSIGRQTVDIVEAHPELFKVVAISAHRRVDEAIDICRRIHPKVLAMCDSEAASQARIRASVECPDVTVVDGEKAMSEIVVRDDVDMVVTATVGYSGLLPTFAAIRAGKDIALANKETLVVGGEYIRKIMKSSPTRIFPVDSEHSAIAQCLMGEDLAAVERLVITASGGPFRTWSLEDIPKATAADALRHPNWNMGAKITIDSATMMNKAFEIIEAHYLFGLPAEKISAVVHPQSIVHSMVEFNDGAIKAQLGVPDMHLPIAFALGMNGRIAGASRRLALKDFTCLTFEEPDNKKFPCLDFARISLNRKGNTACVINAANEVAVDAFLHGKISFTDIPSVIFSTLEKADFIQNPQPDDFVASNNQSRHIAEQLITSIWKQY